MEWIFLLIGLIVGGNVGVLLMCCLRISSDCCDDDWFEKRKEMANEDKSA